MTDSMIEKIQKWEMDDILYIKTRATKHVISCIKQHNCVSVLGPSGCGKTTLARHVALQMENNGYTIIAVTDAKEIEKSLKMNRKTLFIVDDICGNFTANQSRIEEWKRSMNDIKSILENGNCKLILTCRLQVFQDKGFTNLEIFKTCECNLMSDALSLTSEEKKNMTALYFKNHASEALQHLGEYEFLPFLCQLYYVQRNNPHLNLKMFFDNPFSFYEKELPRMYHDCAEGKYKYCALLLLVIFNNKLEPEHLTGKNPEVEKIIEDIMEVCEIDENLTGRKLKFQLEILIGTFVTYDEGIYKTIHDKLFDFLGFYFGTQKKFTDFVIEHAEDRFIRERFVVTDDNEDTHYLIRISGDKLQMYMKRVFADIVSSCNVKDNIVENKNLQNVKFRAMLLDYMGQFQKHEIIAFMEKANTDFLNRMFVMRKKDIKHHVGNRFKEYKCFGIILPDDMLQQYIDKWFNALIKTNSTQTLMEDNRLLKCVTFRTALKSHIRQLNTEKIAYIIQTGSTDFLNTMIVMAEYDVNNFARNQNERFGIVIPEGMVHNYIDRWFNDLTNYIGENIFEDDEYGINFAMPSSLRSLIAATWMLSEFINKNRPLMNPAFRYALCTYIKELTTEKIASLIHTAKDSFLNTMFVMTQDEINDHAENRYEWFGIVIPDDLLQQYIDKYFNGLTNEFWLVDNIYMNRALTNVKGRTALRSYMKQLNEENIASLIQNSVSTFFNTMFVLEEDDIKENSENQYECFGIVIPEDLLQQFIERWFKVLTETWDVEKFVGESRVLKNVIFRTSLCDYMRQLNTEKIASLILNADKDFIKTMFVIAEKDIKDNSENQYECFGIVIPEDLLLQYIDRWFNGLTETLGVEYFIGDSRVLKNVIFRTSLCDYMRQLNTEKIAFLILNAHKGFINTMFVIAEKDIKDNSENQYECFGIVIPDDLLQQYIERCFKCLTETYHLEKYIGKNRPIKNVSFRIALNEYIRQFNTEIIASLIWNAGGDFINTMFVMKEEDIKDNSVNRYECFGIVIPDDLLHQYIERWFDRLTKTNQLEEYIGKNRPIKNVTFRIALNEYMRQFNTEKIASLIWNANGDFINTMFVMAKEDINDKSENRFECFGIVIPDDLLHQYIERWFQRLTKTSDLEKVINKNRPIKNVTFRIALDAYMRQFNTEKIASLIWNANGNFINTMYVMAKENIKDNTENRFECFGIVIPDDLIQQYVERWFQWLTKASELENFINKNRPLKNISFRFAFSDYLKQLITEKIASLIWNANADFINIMFVMAKEDINNNAENRYECFGIVIPDDLIQQYIKRLFECFSKTSELQKYIEKNRPIQNVSFRIAFSDYMGQLNRGKIASLILNENVNFINTMFVMTEDDIKDDNAEHRFECFGIILPDGLLQHYIGRLFDGLSKSDSVKNLFDANRSFRNETFQISLRTYTKQLSRGKVENFIQTGSRDFINTMFVMTDYDMKENFENRLEYFGIILPDDLLQQYISRLVDGLTKTDSVCKCLGVNRCFMNTAFRISLQTYIKQLTQGNITNLIWTGSRNFVNTMFVIAEDDIKEDSENRLECFGIILPDNLLYQYIERWFGCMTKTDLAKQYIDGNRTFTNSKFQANLDTYINGINAEKIALLNRKEHIDYLNTRRDLLKENSTS